MNINSWKAAVISCLLGKFSYYKKRNKLHVFEYIAAWLMRMITFSLPGTTKKANYWIKLNLRSRKDTFAKGHLHTKKLLAPGCSCKVWNILAPLNYQMQMQNIWYFKLNLSAKFKFSIYIISLNLKTIRVKILCWLLLSFKIKIPARPVTHFTTLWIIWVVSLTLRRKQKVFLLDVWKNGKQINEELSFKSIVAPAIGDSYQ